MKKISFEINNEILELYREYYFDKYPRRRKFPILSPIPRSLNQWMIMQRPQMNDTKQKWKEFGKWLVEHYGFDGLKIRKCSVEIIYYFATKRKHDLDNYPPKFIFDSFVDAELVEDDNYNNINPITIRGEYRKKNPGTKFIFTLMEDNNDKEMEKD